MDPRASFIAGAVAAGFSEKQAEFLWTGIPFHPLVEGWKGRPMRIPTTPLGPVEAAQFYLTVSPGP